MFKHIGVGASAGILAANSLLGGHANPIDRSENPEFSDDEPLEPPPATNGTSSGTHSPLPFLKGVTNQDAYRSRDDRRRKGTRDRATPCAL